MIEYAFYELLWVLVVFGGPVLMAVAWNKYKQRKARKLRYIYFTPAELDSSGWPARQKRKDDHIFKTVEEYRNDVG